MTFNTLPTVITNGKLPTRANIGDAGLDIYAAESALVEFGNVIPIKTGVYISIPPAYVGLFMDKSGLGIKEGIIVVGGVIDSTYRGELIVILSRVKYGSYEFNAGDKICQLVIVPYLEIAPLKVDSLDTTERGNNGFGSSGK